MFIRSLIHPSDRPSVHYPQALPGLNSALLGLKSSLSGLKSALSGLESVLSSFKSALTAARSERADLRPEKANFGLERAWGNRQTDKRTNEQMNEQTKVPSVLQVFLPCGAAVLLPFTPFHHHAKQGNRYR